MKKEINIFVDHENQWLSIDCHMNDMGTYTPGGPVLIAHDIIEHVNGVDAIGTFEDEMMALGAYCYSRQKYSPDAGDVHNDINNMIDDYNMLDKMDRFSVYPVSGIMSDILDKEYISGDISDEYFSLLNGAFCEGARRAEAIWPNPIRMYECFEAVKGKLEHLLATTNLSKFTIEVDTDQCEVLCVTLGETKPEVVESIEGLCSTKRDINDCLLEDYEGFEVGESFYDCLSQISELHDVDAEAIYMETL